MRLRSTAELGQMLQVALGILCGNELAATPSLLKSAVRMQRGDIPEQTLHSGSPNSVKRKTIPLPKGVEVWSRSDGELGAAAV
jgi:hypothetical protein